MTLMLRYPAGVLAAIFAHMERARTKQPIQSKTIEVKRPEGLYHVAIGAGAQSVSVLFESQRDVMAELSAEQSRLIADRTQNRIIVDAGTNPNAGEEAIEAQAKRKKVAAAALAKVDARLALLQKLLESHVGPVRTEFEMSELLAVEDWAAMPAILGDQAPSGKPSKAGTAADKAKDTRIAELEKALVDAAAEIERYGKLVPPDTTPEAK